MVKFLGLYDAWSSHKKKCEASHFFGEGGVFRFEVSHFFCEALFCIPPFAHHLLLGYVLGSKKIKFLPNRFLDVLGAAKRRRRLEFDLSLIHI